jgi:hypothetical protein
MFDVEKRYRLHSSVTRIAGKLATKSSVARRTIFAGSPLGAAGASVSSQKP